MSRRASASDRRRDVRCTPGETVLEVARATGSRSPRSATTPARARRRLPHLPGRGRGPAPAAARLRLARRPAWRSTTESSGSSATGACSRLYLADHRLGRRRLPETGNANQLCELAHETPPLATGAGRGAAARPRRRRNPYIAFDPSAASSARAARATATRSRRSAPSRWPARRRDDDLDGRRASLLDTTCELCGGCIDVCPTGAMSEKKPLAAASPSATRRRCAPPATSAASAASSTSTSTGGRRRGRKVTSPPPGRPSTTATSA